MRQVFILRLGHRIIRDKRVTMHIFLTARALSATGVFYSGERDKELEKGIRNVVVKWGGPFEVKYKENWEETIKNWKKRGVMCHLTMYGISVDSCLDKIPKNKDVLVIVGSQKVSREVYQSVDFNIAIGNQPHSEVAALAIFLDRLFEGSSLKREFEDAKTRIVPQERGKKVIEGD